MTMHDTPDILELAEAVARGSLRPADAERQVRATFTPADGARASEAARELVELVASVRAVQAHARATHAAIAGSSLAAGSEVAGLVAGLAAGTAIDIRVRPGPVRGRTISRGGKVGRQTGMLAAAAFLLVAGLVGASAIGSSPPSTAPSPSVAAVSNASSTPGATLQASPDAGLATEPGMFGPGFRFDLASDAVGWVWAKTGVYRTSDMGATWVKVLPIELQVAVVLDANTMYGVSAVEPGHVTINATHDGGATWTSSVINEPAAPMLSFRDPMTGSATFVPEDPNAPSRSDLNVYATTDGGRAWTGPTAGTDAVTSPGFNKIQGRDGNVLWLSNGKADNEPFDNRLALSVTGGVTWASGFFPDDSIAPAGVLKWPLAVWQGAGDHIVLALGIDGGTTAVYDSNDAGKTWNLKKSWPQPLRGDFQVHLLSDETWILAAPNGSEVWSTTDGGGTWRRTVNASPVALGGSSFASPDRGWASLYLCVDPTLTFGGYPKCKGTGVKTELRSTTDGGATWTTIVP
ncbi:MAG: hypothetical protein ABIV26_07545 [Candidatus Limnocylindrales bacterium]